MLNIKWSKPSGLDLKKALLFMVISTFSFALMNVSVKYLARIPTFQIVFFRCFGSFVLATTFILIKGIPIFGNKRRLMLLRAILGLTAMSLFFLSLKHLHVGTAVSLRYIAPIFAAIFAVFLLKEKLKNIQWLFFITAFAGVLVLKGFDGNINTTGLTLILTASVFSGMVYVVIRKIGVSDHPAVVVNYFMFVGTAIGGLLAITVWVQPIGYEWAFLFLLGIFGFMGQIYMTKAFQIAKTNLVAPLKYIEVIFTISIGVFWFNEAYSIYSFIGLFMIISALILNTLVKKD
ncbi:DMT family transporter [Arenibacter hampyeongensis]|uniref:DMT family transporter n=1 Tax=Arenibacter hampyeongensis TaxID=1028743 RepID=UPI0021D0364D|nr:DMT family transporter [Arenibacter hampyeongensis]